MERYCPYKPKEYQEGLSRNLAQNCPFCEKMMLDTCKWWDRKLQEEPIYEKRKMGRR